jgi:adenylate cyclase
VPSRGVLMWSVLAPLLEVITTQLPSYLILAVWIGCISTIYNLDIENPFAKLPEESPDVFWLLNLMLPLALVVFVVGTLNRQLQLEKMRYRALLCNMMPRLVADRLLQYPKALIAHEFSHASVMFIDLVQFTQWTQQVCPSRLVSVLSDLFTLFDGIALQNGVEKIKTIGDCFLAAVGVPEQINSVAGANRMCKCALECVAALTALMINMRPNCV